jgi:hypothetical protein
LKEGEVDVGAGDPRVGQLVSVAGEVPSIGERRQHALDLCMHPGVVGIGAEETERLMQPAHGGGSMQRGVLQRAQENELAPGGAISKLGADRVQLSQCVQG